MTSFHAEIFTPTIRALLIVLLSFCTLLVILQIIFKVGDYRMRRYRNMSPEAKEIKRMMLDDMIVTVIRRRGRNTTIRTAHGFVETVPSSKLSPINDPQLATFTAPRVEEPDS